MHQGAGLTRRVKQGTKEELRWWLVLLLGAAGVVLLVVAFDPFGFAAPWSSVETAVFVDSGTAAFLAAILVVLEPYFWRGVKERAKAVQEPVTAELADLQQKVQDLTQRTKDLVRVRDEEVDQALTAVAESPSFETVTRALRIAQDLKALAGGIATVQGGTDLNDADHPFLSMRVRFLWGSSPSAPEPSLLVQAVCDSSQFAFTHQGEPEPEDEPAQQRLPVL